LSRIKKLNNPKIVLLRDTKKPKKSNGNLEKILMGVKRLKENMWNKKGLVIIIEK